MEVKLTDTQVSDLIKSERPWNRARRAFSNGMARIAAMGNLTPLSLRRAELLVVADIAHALGVMLVSDPDPDAPRAEPGPSPWTEAERASGASEPAPAPGGPVPDRNAP